MKCLAAFVAAGLMGVPAHALTADQDLPPLLVEIVNQAEVPPEVLEEARSHVVRIYERAGIRVSWSSEADSNAFWRTHDAVLWTVVLVPEHIAENVNEQPTVTGLALSSKGLGVRRAYVFSDRVQHIVEEGRARLRTLRSPAAEGLMLGHVIAHELGHLLLPPGHTLNGIMRAEIDAEGIRQAATGRLLFTPDQAKRLRSTLAVAWMEKLSGQMHALHATPPFPPIEDLTTD